MEPLAKQGGGGNEPPNYERPGQIINTPPDALVISYPNFAHHVIITVQKYIAWAGILLLPFAIFITLHWTITRLKSK